MPKLRVKISGEHEDDVKVRWRYKNEYVKNGGHYGIGYGGIYLVVYDALPVHSGWYYATVYRKNDGRKLGATQFLLTVRGKTTVIQTVPCPFKEQSNCKDISGLSSILPPKSFNFSIFVIK